MTDTISAISTAPVASGVAVIRLSGSDSLNVAKKMFRPVGNVGVENFEPRKMYLGEIDCDGFSDMGLMVYFAAPNSFTGEDVVEFHSHGGVAITRGILRNTVKHGARLAVGGEFTKRAFMNGKLSLSSAEGLIEMINGESVAQAKAGYSLYREKLTKEVNSLQDMLTDALSEIDADMDFPEEDLEIAAHEKVKEALVEVSDRIKKLLDTYRSGRTIVNGVKVGIVGKPNTGKSSLLNALLSYDKAIVSSVAGTTRDIVEGSIEINGVRFNFSDTAGIRSSSDEIESMGVMLSKKVLDESNILLFVLSAVDIDRTDEEIAQLIKDKNVLTVINKCDLKSCDYPADIEVSAKDGYNIENLKNMLFTRATGGEIDLNGDFICEERHYDALKRAYDKLTEAIAAADTVTLDLLSIDIKAGWDYLGEISGKTATEEIINNIFSKFCVGK